MASIRNSSVACTAAVLLALLPSADSAEWQQSLQTALQAHQAGDLVGAAPHYREALELNPDLRQHGPLLTNYGLALQAEGDKAAAVEAFRTSLALSPDSSDAYYNLGQGLNDAGQLPEAVEALQSCLQLNPEDADAYYDLGMAMLRQGGSARTEAAVGHVRSAIALNPTDGKAWVCLGDGLAAQAAWSESREAYRDACKLRPEHVPSWASLGNAEEECGLAADAEASWRRAIKLGEGAAGGAGGETGGGGARDGEIAESVAGCYQNLGAMLRRADRQAESRAAYAAAIKLVPDSAEAYLGMGKSGAAPIDGLASGNRAYLQFLAETYGAALTLQPTHAGAYTAIAEGLRMYGMSGGCEELGGKDAVDFYKAALALVPNNTLALTHVAYSGRQPADEAATERLMCADADGNADVRTCDAADDGSGGLFNHAAGGQPPTIDTLSAPAPVSAAALETALGLWRRNGLAIFPGLVDSDTVDALLADVRSAQHGNHTADYTPVTRDKRHRSHKALPVGEARPALDAIAEKLQPFFAAALGTEAPALLESGFMVASPGASDQMFHRDVAPAVVSRSSVTVSVQVSLVDTAANQGCLEVLPGSQVFSTAVSDHERRERMPSVKVAVPKGTVTVYALHTMHRGTANTHTADRPFYFFTLLGEGLAPPGLAYTIQPDDVGKWRFADGAVAPASM